MLLNTVFKNLVKFGYLSNETDIHTIEDLKKVNKKISYMTKLIAEIGWNFIGDMVLAKEMIVAAKGPC